MPVEESRLCLQGNVGGWNLPQFGFKSLVWQFHHFWYTLLLDPDMETEGMKLCPSIFVMSLSFHLLWFILPAIGSKVNMVLEGIFSEIRDFWFTFPGDGKSLLKQEQIQSQEMQDQEAATNTNDNTETIWIVDKNRGVRPWYFLLFEILVLVNLISAIFVTKFSVYGLEEGPDTSERQILLGLQYGNVCLLIANWILCYFYSTNLTWWLPLLVINIIGHRYYPRYVCKQRNINLLFLFKVV